MMSVRGDKGCEWCVINMGRGACTFVVEVENCPLSDKEVVKLNRTFSRLMKRANKRLIKEIRAKQDQGGE